jgi:general secretion pathway protein L
MIVIAIFKRWIEVLATLLISVRESWRAAHLLSVVRGDGCFTIGQAGPDGVSVLATVPLGAQVSAEVASAAGKSLVVLELPLDKVVTRTIRVPSQAQEFLAGIVQNQIERLSPWQSDQTIFGFDTKISHEDAAALDVRILITSRSVVDGVRDEVAATGLSLDRVVAGEHDEANPSQSVLMWSRFADASHDEIQRARWLVGATIAGCVVLSASLSLWATLSAFSLGAESERLAVRSRAFQQQIQGTSTASPAVSLKPGERAWIAKETSPSAVIILEALSRALPDFAYLTEFQLEKETLRIVGLTSDAPSLIAPLEGAGYLADVHFFAPTTRAPDGVRFKFYIEARVNPLPKLVEPQPW